MKLILITLVAVIVGIMVGCSKETLNPLQPTSIINETVGT